MGVEAGLSTLRASGWRLAVVTNGGTEVQTAKIRQVSLERLVDDWTISEAAGIAKPDPRMLEIAAAAIGKTLSPSDWIVGDSAEHDIAAGRNAGIRSVWLSRGREWSEPDFRPTLVTETAAGALALVSGQTQLRVSIVPQPSQNVTSSTGLRRVGPKFASGKPRGMRATGAAVSGMPR